MASIQNIRGSDGTGAASRATLTSSRAISNPTITVDTLSNWPSQFIAATGTLDEEGLRIEPSTLQVFYGHINGATSIVIDSFADGYEDKGNEQGDIVILKPTTAWANEIADIFAMSHKDDGSIKQVDANAPGVVFSTDSTQPTPDPDGKVIVWFEPL